MQFGIAGLSLAAKLLLVQVGEIIDRDIPAVIALWERCDLTRPWNDPLRDLNLARATSDAVVLVGYVGEELAASVMVGFDGHRGCVYYLAVDPEQQGSGLGRAMMDAAEVWLSSQGAPKLQLMVRETNSAALGFYDRLGFERQPVVTLGKRIGGRREAPADLIVQHEPSDGEAARRLTAALDRELCERYPELVFGDDPSGLTASGGEFFVGYLEGEPVACGAFRPAPDGSAEFKRMYVSLTCRGRGLGRAMLDHLEGEARKAGYTRAVLTTGPRQPEALALYATSGWRRMASPPDGMVDLHSVNMEKFLATPR